MTSHTTLLPGKLTVDRFSAGLASNETFVSNTSAPDPEVLSFWDSQFDPQEQLIREVSGGVAYHSCVKKGQIVHPLRTSAFYAHALLRTGDEVMLDRAVGILNRVIDLQETNPLSPYFGIWGYFLEEPPSAMAPADFNWADFISIHLLEIIHHSAQQLPGGVVERLEATVKNAVLSIFRRNVEVAYTNIAIMGAAASLIAGELLDEELWVLYGKNRLEAVRELFQRNGGFNEYNSSTYSLTALFELERVLRLVAEPQARKDAEILWRAVWDDLSLSYHSATAQLAGPQSRSYNDWFNEGQLRCLESRLGFSLPRLVPGLKLTSCLEELGAPGPIPCPIEFKERFSGVTQVPSFRKQVRVRRPDGRPSQTSSCWMSQEATFGSINQEIGWYQTRPLLGYWRSGEHSIARCRVRVLQNSRDFASALLTTDQVGPTLLSACQLILGGGTYHPLFDRPTDGIFQTNDLRFRLEVEGPLLSMKQTSSNAWWIGNNFGGLNALFGPAMFDGRQVDFVHTSVSENLFVFELVLHTGATINLEPARLGETFATVLLHWSSEPTPQFLAPITNTMQTENRLISCHAAEPALALVLGKHPMERNRLVEGSGGF